MAGRGSAPIRSSETASPSTATVIVVEVEQAFQHCPKALVRSRLWQAAAAGRPAGAPTLGDFAAARNPGSHGAAYDAEYARRMPGELY